MSAVQVVKYCENAKSPKKNKKITEPGTNQQPALCVIDAEMQLNFH